MKSRQKLVKWVRYFEVIAHQKPPLPMQKKEIGFSRIYVVESLEGHEVPTGTRLYNDLLRYREMALKYISAELVVIKNRHDFQSLHAKILNDITSSAQIPYLHFEMHGCVEGMVLSSDELISWTDLYEFCLPINRASGNNLLLSFASCFGAYIFNAIDPTRPTPCFGYIGSPLELYPNEIETSFNAYFETLLRTFDFNQAINALNTSNPLG